MNKIDMKIRLMLLVIGLLMIAGGFKTTVAQDQRWIRVGETQCFFKDYGCEPEDPQGDVSGNFLSWPAQYGDNQHTTRMKGLWIGATDFYDPVEKKIKSVKVIGSGPRLPANQFNMTFPQSIKLIGRYYHPSVVVDNQTGTSNTLYDALDELDDILPCDRMVVIKFNTSMGVSVTRKVLAFTQQNHDNYFIHDYVFKNTGIINEEGNVYPQTLDEFWVYFTYRYAFSGITTAGFGATWGSFGSEWGTSTLLRTFMPGTQIEHDTDPGIRGFYAWYGPTYSWGHALPYEEDWGCPDHEETGVLGSAKYAGGVTLFASESPQEFWTNDPNQPATTAYTGSDGTPTETAVSQYDENFMQQRYHMMTEGHLDHTQVEAVEAVKDRYVEDWTSGPYRDTKTEGSTSQGQGFGPYTLAPDDSIRIVFAEGVSGISWEKCREVGANWYRYYTGTGTPELKMPETNQNDYGYAPHNAYKRAWCETGADSIMQTLRRALANYNSGYKIPQPPPSPEEFTVKSGGDRISLTWADNARDYPNFNGYVIYRSEGNVKNYRTVYKEIFECDGSYKENKFDDVTARRGFNYYYYIQSKDNGSTSEGEILYSSLFLTLTSVPAYLRRPAGDALSQIRVVPNPYNISARALQFGDKSQYDRLAFYGLPPFCQIKIYTERGDLIWSKNHDDGSGDELWDSLTSSGQIVVSGVYIAYFEVTQDFPETGEKVFKKGDSIFRKFVIIR